MSSPDKHQTSPNTQADLSPRAKVSAIVREHYAASAREGDGRDLWISADSAITSTTRRYTHTDGPIEPFEWDMHDLWYLHFQAAMYIDDQSAEQDKLVLQIIGARELGTLTRLGGQNAEGEVITSDGGIWTHLPFLVGDMMGYWVKEKDGMGVKQRQNFSSFLAKLSAAGVRSKELSDIGLVILRDTFEIERPLGRLEATDTGVVEQQQGERQSTEDLSVADLLRAANSWLINARHKTLQLSEKALNTFDDEVGMLGDLAQADGLDSAGFSPQRWIFWIKRLEQIEDQAAVSGNESYATYARRVKENMTMTADETGSGIKRELLRIGKLGADE